MASSKNLPFFLLLLRLISTAAMVAPPGGRGHWTLLKSSIGISGMHMQLLHDDQVIIFDRTDFGPSNLTLPSKSHCLLLHSSSSSSSSVVDCTAHSVLYHVPSNSFRPLQLRSDTWCSSGSVLPNGTLFQTGGYRLGARVARAFTPCSDRDSMSSWCDWSELSTRLAIRRWYASNHILPDGRVIVVGGRGAPNYEFFPKEHWAGLRAQNGPFGLMFLVETSDGGHRENNLYPFLHLLPDGNLFIFANNRSIILDYRRHIVLKEFPVMPGGVRRSYPLTGSSVLLPIDLRHEATSSSSPAIDVMICGGGKLGAFELARRRHHKTYLSASNTCGTLRITDPNPQWAMETMPTARTMGDTVMLPSGDILIINGASSGAAGWDNADGPVLAPVLYRTREPDPAHRFFFMEGTKVPRMYHSAALLVPDGRVLVGGSNPNQYYNFTGVRFPTELSLEAFSPPYLAPHLSPYRPAITGSPRRWVLHGEVMEVRYEVATEAKDDVMVTMLLPPFTTHSFGMNQRLLVLGVERRYRVREGVGRVIVRAPRNVNVAPPGFYLLFVVNGGVPSHGVWVHLRRN
ncbi:hypothetical protein Droror1_Dr00008215 [Drosera rotundifolia]